jgi:hypothetical protein
MAVGSLLSPVYVNFFVGDIGELALCPAANNPLCWFCYIDGTFVYSPQVERLPWSSEQIHQNIHFTAETERDGHFPFLETRTIYTADLTALSPARYTVKPY